MKQKTTRIVLTGGPCCGKTTTLNELTRRGHRTIDEAARLVLEEGIYHPARNVEEFQKAILTRQIQNEQSIDGIAFLDRGAIDGIAYSLLYAGKVPEFFNEHNMRGRYDLVLILDRFPLKNDGVRVESNDEEAQRIHDKIHETYITYGYNPMMVPRMSVEQRADFILNSIEGTK